VDVISHPAFAHLHSPGHHAHAESPHRLERLLDRFPGFVHGQEAERSQIERVHDGAYIDAIDAILEEVWLDEDTFAGATTWEAACLAAGILGAPLAEVVTTSPEGDLYVTVPQGTSSGDVLLFVGEDGTGSMVLETVRIGATNTFWTTEIAGIPLFAVLLGLLVVLLLLVTFVLWRRGGAGARMAPAAGKPVPPPPPSGPATAAPGTGPMSVVCRHCGKPIDITTSKRPIEIMCPACGETQIVP